MNAALIVAAGRGHRMGGPIPKQYRDLDNTPILRHTLVAFLRHPEIGHTQVVIHPNDRDLYDRAVQGLDLPPPVTGGATRQESVRFGLESVAGLNPAKVIIHDGVRPFVEQAAISTVLAALDRTPAVITGVPVVDTLKRAPGGLVSATVDRAEMWRAQTPQGFQFGRILAAHQKLHRHDPNSAGLTDDSLVAESDAMPVAMVLGSEDNIKITTERDLARAELILSRGRQEVHTGFGFQRSASGDTLLICGIPVPHAKPVERDDPADIALDAVADALVGTVGGLEGKARLQPAMPPRRGMASDVLVRRAMSIVALKGGRIVHVDMTVLSGTPDIGPDHGAMLERLATLLETPVSRLSIKQVASPGPGLSDRTDGIGVQCVATVQYPSG